MSTHVYDGGLADSQSAGAPWCSLLFCRPFSVCVLLDSLIAGVFLSSSF